MRGIEVMELEMVKMDMVREFQCPGCTCGSDPKTCDAYKPLPTGEAFRCVNHSAGTFIVGRGSINLGLPIGFSRVIKKLDLPGTNIRLHLSHESYQPDKFNVAVWAFEQDGFLFVRTYCPRIDVGWVDVVKGAKIEQYPSIAMVLTQEDLDNMD